MVELPVKDKLTKEEKRKGKLKALLSAHCTSRIVARSTVEQIC